MPMSAEVYAWPEGELLVWTGSASPVAVARVNNARHREQMGWLNSGPTVGGVYTDHLTGMRADVNIDAGFTYDMTLPRIMEAATAVHMEFRYAGVNGSAGYKFWSGRIDAHEVYGGQNSLINFTLAYHANIWSAYGG